MTANTRKRAERIVSLVPSLTEALFSLGLGERVVGVTDWCVHPADRVAALPRVGGTKNPSIEQIAALAPDLVIANREENRPRAIEALREAGIDVWVTYPRTVREGAELFRQLAGLGAAREVIDSVVQPVEEALRRAEETRPARGVPVFCPIWKTPWMVFGGDTYASNLLELCGGANVFADRGDRRYPIIEPSEIVDAAPEVILLPDEPYNFGPRDAFELSELPVPAARDHRIHLIDGTLVSWYGPRIGRAIPALRGLIIS
jgi:ABC-type Fe3+-hydroxamate transport system substrate-binding protein